MLFLFRHSKAVDIELWKGEDSERPITTEGKQRMQQLAQGLIFLKERLQNPVLYTSPYLRAVETAEILAEIWELKSIQKPLFSPGWDGRLSEDWVNQDIIIVGHMPDLSEVVSTFTKGKYLIDFQPPSVAILAKSKEKIRLRGYFSWELFEE